MTIWQRIPALVRSVVIGLTVALVGTVPWARLIAANVRQDASFLVNLAGLVVAVAVTALAYRALFRAARTRKVEIA